MNKWTKESIKLGNTKGYLDTLFDEIYVFKDTRHKISETKWTNIKESYNSKNSFSLLNELLTNQIFPFEHPVVGYFRMVNKSDNDWFSKNPVQVNKLLDKIYKTSLDEIYKSLTRLKKLNQQIGPMFKKWIDKSTFCIPKIKINNYRDNNKNCILIGSDKDFREFAKKKFNYSNKKGLDFIAKKNGKFIVGEQKLITNVGGNQDKSLVDINRLIESNLINCTKIGIIDGVLYLKNEGNLYKTLTDSKEHQIMLSALLLDSFLKEFN